mmetsp:Transcript_5218/g.11400  ORF Transcript_5218/g.11400 Transcript_5218/m.11400 type:complete len:142 (+) Transcript_5218:611-1036(+)
MNHASAPCAVRALRCHMYAALALELHNAPHTGTISSHKSSSLCHTGRHRSASSQGHTITARIITARIITGRNRPSNLMHAATCGVQHDCLPSCQIATRARLHPHIRHMCTCNTGATGIIGTAPGMRLVVHPGYPGWPSQVP